jgi:hypothetical protein
MMFDPHEMTVRDPLEETVPDPVRRRSRLSGGRRRAVELVALLVVLPGLLAVYWMDDRKQAAQWDPQERVTVVARGGTGTLGHVRLRVLGRDATASSAGTTAGAAKITLIVELRALDAKGAKDSVTYTVRDRDGHVWTALGLPAGGHDPVVGAATPVKVTADVPVRLTGSVVLEARLGSFGATGHGPTQVLRFAH